MALIHRERNLIFLAEPHTASRAVKRALLRAENGWEYVMPHHATTYQLIENNVLTEAEVLASIILSVIRNPLDVLVTQWRYSSFQNGSFASYLGEVKGKPELEEPLRGYWKQANRIIYYEHLTEDWRWFFPKGPPLEHFHADRTDKKGHWSDHYRDKLSWVAYLLEQYKEFLDAYGYQIDPQTLRCQVDEQTRTMMRGQPLC